MENFGNPESSFLDFTKVNVPVLPLNASINFEVMCKYVYTSPIEY